LDLSLFLFQHSCSNRPPLSRLANDNTFPFKHIREGFMLRTVLVGMCKVQEYLNCQLLSTLSFSLCIDTLCKSGSDWLLYGLLWRDEMWGKSGFFPFLDVGGATSMSSWSWENSIKEDSFLAWTASPFSIPIFPSVIDRLCSEWYCQIIV
jgi:hypothetical protein